MRAYSPVDAAALETLEIRGSFVPTSLVAVTDDIRALVPDGDEELFEHVAAQFAAALATTDPIALVALDLPEADVAVISAPRVPGLVDGPGDVARQRVACFLVADRGARVSEDMDLELSWYDVSERTQVRALLQEERVHLN